MGVLILRGRGGGAASWNRIVHSVYQSTNGADKIFVTQLRRFLNAQENSKGDLVFIDDSSFKKLFTGTWKCVENTLQHWQQQVGF